MKSYSYLIQTPIIFFHIYINYILIFKVLKLLIIEATGTIKDINIYKLFLN